MSYLTTVVTYNTPSEAEIDKSFLESHGFAVCLLNGNTARNELGTPFYIQLQVPDEDYSRAVEVLKAANPQRFGSAARASQLEREFFGSILRFLLGAIPIGLLVYFLVPAPSLPDGQAPFPAGFGQGFDLRPAASIVAAVTAGSFLAKFARKRRTF